jgi:RNA-directed DNA polymerase
MKSSPSSSSFCCERGLQLSPEKTCVTHIDEGFDFLGQHLRKYGGKLLDQTVQKNTHASLEKVRGIFRCEQIGSRQESLIRLLNPVIRGWVNYHRHIVAKEAFERVDHGFGKALALGQTQTSRKIATMGGWPSVTGMSSDAKRTFAADTGKTTPEGKPIWLKLVDASDTSIRRYVKNPGGSQSV